MTPLTRTLLLLRLAFAATFAIAGGAAIAAITPSAGAPDFTLPSLDGPNLRLHEQRGQVVMINFWATWCGPCRVEMPHRAKLYEKFLVVVVEKSYKHIISEDGLIVLQLDMM